MSRNYCTLNEKNQKLAFLRDTQDVVEDKRIKTLADECMILLIGDMHSVLQCLFCDYEIMTITCQLASPIILLVRFIETLSI